MKLFYAAYHDKKLTTVVDIGKALEACADAKDWFVVSVLNGKVTLCGHGLGTFDDKWYSAALARIKNHFKGV